MKRYEINCHYDMVVTVEVFAENEEQAKEFARERADRMDLQHDGECMGYQACVTDCEDVADKVARLRELEHGLVTRLVTKAILDYKETDNEQGGLFMRNKLKVGRCCLIAMLVCCISLLASGICMWLTFFL